MARGVRGLFLKIAIPDKRKTSSSLATAEIGNDAGFFARCDGHRRRRIPEGLAVSTFSRAITDVNEAGRVGVSTRVGLLMG